MRRVAAFMSRLAVAILALPAQPLLRCRLRQLAAVNSCHYDTMAPATHISAGPRMLARTVHAMGLDRIMATTMQFWGREFYTHTSAPAGPRPTRYYTVRRVGNLRAPARGPEAGIFSRTVFSYREPAQIG